MMDRKSLLRLAEAVTPTGLRSYALAHGWEPVSGTTRPIWLLRHQAHPLRQLQIPKDQDEDTPEAIIDSAQRIAEIEQRPLQSVLNDVLTTNADVLRFRVIADDAKGGSLSLDEGASLLDGAKKVLRAAACSVVNPVAHHPRTDRNEVRQLFKKSRLGQTELGSFVLKIACPLDAVPDPSVPLTQPFVRESTSLLMRACSKLVAGIENNTLEHLLEQEETSNKHEITSNLCEGLIRLRAERDSGSVAIETTWASSTKLPPPPEIPNLLRIPVEYFPEIEKAHQALRPAPDSDREQYHIGTVETLNGDVCPDGRRAGEVILALLLPAEEEVIRARAMLSADDYLKAVNAHERGQGYVKLKGILRRGIRVSRLEQVSGFGALDRDSA